MVNLRFCRELTTKSFFSDEKMLPYISIPISSLVTMAQYDDIPGIVYVPTTSPVISILPALVIAMTSLWHRASSFSVMNLSNR